MPVIKNPALRDRNSFAIFGCNEADAINLNTGLPLRQYGTRAHQYCVQRQSAKRRGISWEITFHEWVSIWAASGHVNNRGVGIGSFCMARNGDAGPYKAGNVSIQTVQQNSSDALKKARHSMVANAAQRGYSAILGSGRGWTHRKNARRPYQVMVANTYIGCFFTQEEAETAYRAAVAEHHANRSVDGVTE